MTDETENTTSQRPLELRLADWRERANSLRITGHGHDADLIEKVVEDVREGTLDYMTFVDEDDAIRRTGKSVKWLRARHAEWMRSGNARFDERGRRMYRLCVLPVRPNLSAAREAGRRAAQHRKSA